jgi:hypothetical protein
MGSEVSSAAKKRQALQGRGQINQIADCSRSIYYQRGEGKAAAQK